MIRGTVTGGKKAQDGLKARGEKARSLTETLVMRLTMKLLRRVKLKLSDDVLNVRTGRLRRSINTRFSSPAAGKTEGAVGTNIPYAKQHEFGETVNVKAHLRLVKQAWGRQLKTPVWSNVSAHSVTYPERSFLRSALAEMRGEIQKDLRQTAKEVAK